MAELASFWVGGPLGDIEIASIKSFLRHGDKITIYSYKPIQLPNGAKSADAATILPGNKILRDQKTQSPALHSDLFRYALLAKTDKIWVDLDVIALRSFKEFGEWVFGYESNDSINCAVLRLPKDSKTLQELIKLTPDTVGIPEFFSQRRRIRYLIRTLGRGLPIDRWKWAWAGPRALTHALIQTGEIKHALPISAFYSVSYDDVEKFVAPGALPISSFPKDSWAIHLWASQLRTVINQEHGGRAPRDSFLDLALRDKL